MDSLEVKGLEAHDEVRGRTQFVALPGARIGRATFEAGWRWSVHSKPVFGGESCQTTHVGYMIAGRLAIRLADGTEGEIGAGSAFQIPPGHDAWVVGDEACTFVEFFAAGSR